MLTYETRIVACNTAPPGKFWLYIEKCEWAKNIYIITRYKYKLGGAVKF
jgi:hypothetical protein